MSTDRREQLSKATEARIAAKRAHARGDRTQRDAHLRAAAELYRGLGATGMAKWCERFIGH